MSMTKGQLEAKISEIISKFEVEHMGRGPEKIRTIIFQDLIIVRIKGFLSKAETNLATTKDGVELIKKVRMALFENSRENLEDAIKALSARLKEVDSIAFDALFEGGATRTIVVTTFLALLEMLKLKRIRVLQDEMFSGILIQRREPSDTEEALIQETLLEHWYETVTAEDSHSPEASRDENINEDGTVSENTTAETTPEQNENAHHRASQYEKGETV